MGSDHPVRLRQAVPADADLLDAWHTPEFLGDFNQFGVSFEPMRQAIERTGLLGEHGGQLIIETAAGEPVGTVSWHAVRYGPNPESTALNVGINLIPSARGRGLGAVAQRLLVEYLFARTSANRIEAMTDVDNVAEQRSLEKAGFVREGVAIGAQFRAGAWHDLVVYSAVRPAG
ncbi:MAG TPA: GNAT family protein [Candidatus Dormibacteraeota bacterium]|nr:GNAT family protein [Candidatus Dormibacteraeota bacterium]